MCDPSEFYQSQDIWDGIKHHTTLKCHFGMCPKEAEIHGIHLQRKS